jgi:hypothetical protein
MISKEIRKGVMSVKDLKDFIKDLPDDTNVFCFGFRDAMWTTKIELSVDFGHVYIKGLSKDD